MQLTLLYYNIRSSGLTSARPLSVTYDDDHNHCNSRSNRHQPSYNTTGDGSGSGFCLQRYRNNSGHDTIYFSIFQCQLNSFSYSYFCELWDYWKKIFLLTIKIYFSIFQCQLNSFGYSCFLWALGLLIKMSIVSSHVCQSQTHKPGSWLSWIF